MPQKRKRKGHAVSKGSKQAKTDTSQDENRTQNISEVSEDTQNSLTQEPASAAASDDKEQEPQLTKEVGEKTNIICNKDIKCDEAASACNEPLVNVDTKQVGETENESDCHKCYTCDEVLQVVSKESVIMTDDINSKTEDGTSNNVDVDSPDEGFHQHSLSILQPGDYDDPLMDSSKSDIGDLTIVTIGESDRCDKEKSLSTSLLAPGLSEHDICKLTEAQGNTDIKPERDTFLKETDVNVSMKSSHEENLEEQDIVSYNQELELDNSNSRSDHDSAILSPKKCISSEVVERNMSMANKHYENYGKDGVTAEVTTGLSKIVLYSFQQAKVSKRRNYGSDGADMLFLSQPTMSLKRGLDKDISGSHRQIKKLKPPAKESKSRDICEDSTKPTVAVDTNCLHSLNTNNINDDGEEVAPSVDSAVCVKQEDTKAAHPSSGKDLTIQTVENGKQLDLAENVDQDTMAREGEMTEDKKMCGEMANKEKSLCVHDALVEVIKILVSDVSAKDDIDKTITTKAVDAVVPMHTKENFDNESENDGQNFCQKIRPQDLSRTEEIDETEKLSHRVRVFAQRTDANGQDINDEASADNESICHGVRDDITEEEAHDMISPKVPLNCIGKDNEKKETQVSCHSNQETSSQVKTGNTDASATLQDTSGVENVEEEELPIVARSVEVKHTEKKLYKNVSEHVHEMTDPDNHERQSSNLEHLQLSDYTTQIHDDTTHNGSFDDTTHKISHNNEEVSDGTSQKQLPSALPDTTSHSDDGGTLLHEEKKTNSLYLGEVKCVTGDIGNVTEEKSEWTCSMTIDPSCDRENDKETFEGTQPFSTSTCTLYNDDNCLSNSYQEIQNKTQIISMPTQDYSTAATVDSVDKDLTGSNNNNTCNTTVDLTQKLTCQTSAKLPCEDFFADILNEFDMHSSKPPLDHSANSNSKQITISDNSVFADKAASCVDKHQSNTAVVTPKCQKMNTSSMTACVQTSSSKIIPKLLKTDPASASREANRINHPKDGQLNKTEDVEETPDEPLQQLPSDTVMDMSESQLCQLSREDIYQDFGSCIDVSSNEEEGEHNNEKFETDFAQAQQKAVDEIVKKKTEGENLASAIMKDLVSINKQLLRMKKEMETAKRKIAQQQQQHHQQQHKQPQYQRQQQHKPGFSNNGKSTFGFGQFS